MNTCASSGKLPQQFAGWNTVIDSINQVIQLAHSKLLGFERLSIDYRLPKTSIMA